MRTLLLLAALSLAVPTARADPVGPACELEEFLLGWDEACAELRDPTRVVGAAGCIWTDAECAPLADVEFEGDWGTYYVSAAPPGVFRETNGCAGFQAADGPCGPGDEPADPQRVIPW